MKIRLFEENDIKPIYELLKNELGYEVDYSLFVFKSTRNDKKIII